MEIIVGKKFKLEVWEKCLKSMRLNEVAEFRATRVHCASYPAVAKTLRDIKKGAHAGEHNHSKKGSCCAGWSLEKWDFAGNEFESHVTCF